MNNILNKYFKDETIFITGSSYYKIPDIIPKDIDVCILCNDANEHYYKITNSIKKFAKDNGVKTKHMYIEEYDMPFDWNGRTFGRLKCKPYDFFLVDKNTFKTIEFTSIALRRQPKIIKELMKNKTFRVDLFQLITIELQ